MIARKGGISEHVLRTAPEGTIFNKLFLKHFGTKEQVKIDSIFRWIVLDSFFKKKEDEYWLPEVAPALELLMTSEVKSAYYYVAESVYTHAKYKCR